MLDRPRLDLHGVALTDLAQGCCRWPVGEDEDGETFFCGAPVATRPGHGLAARTYCACHADLSRIERKPFRPTRAIR
ncbi:GcrA family cell cycle regulator [Methylocella sp.]|uniref:GcrA family cell cycle regulator n=1 Tax=Methylocella sp. TaxID=1978226 RepID=UPI00378435B9